MSNLQSQDYIRISATTITPPSVRRHEQEVAKLIDVTRCIGCKACQSACMEWNDLRGEVGHFEGTYDNPARSRSQHLDAHALHRMGERQGRPRMADPQGRLHALRGSGLPQGLSRARRDRSIRQRHRRFHQRELHRLRLLHQGLPVRHPARQQDRSQILQMHALLRPRHRRRGAGLRQGLPDGRDPVRLEVRHDALGWRARRSTSRRAASRTPASTIRPGSAERM